MARGRQAFLKRRAPALVGKRWGGVTAEAALQRIGTFGSGTNDQRTPPSRVRHS